MKSNRNIDGEQSRTKKRDSWKETQEIMSNPDLMREIQQNLDAIQKGKVTKYTLDELFGGE